jgi:hypothetical protein
MGSFDDMVISVAGEGAAGMEVKVCGRSMLR